MTLSDELSKLADLNRSGILTDDEFSRAKAQLLNGAPDGYADTPLIAKINALRRSRSDRWLAGVCGGLASSTGIESWVWRIFFAVFGPFAGASMVLYLLLWIFVPSE